jgi:hypothetical protein
VIDCANTHLAIEESELLGNESLGEEELDESAAEGFCGLTGVVDGEEEEPPVGSESPSSRRACR